MTRSVDASRHQGAVSVPCAYCHGLGQDPFRVPSPLSICQVCGGQGWRELPAPVGECPFCGGSGVHPGTRLTCTVCGGVGQVTWPEDEVDCPACDGRGQADEAWPNSPFPCSICAGKGRVSRQIREEM